VPLLLAPSTGAPQGPANRYIGAAKCKNCHQAKESGDQYGIWTTEKHAKAFEELASAKAKEYGKARGVDDPQTSEKCLKCHVTAYGKPAAEMHRSFDPKLGVQCETCHGPGEQHMKARMAAAAAVDEKQADKKPAYAVIPDAEIIKTPTVKTCVSCHNEESPGFKPFCFHKYLGDIRHLNPLKPRTDAEKAALLACACDKECICKKGSPDGKCTMPPKQAVKSEAAKPDGGM
jgi:hypothetical protein